MVRYYPDTRLQQFVSCLWYSSRSMVEHPCEHLSPTGAMTIVIRLDGDPIHLQDQLFHESVVMGPQSGFVLLDTSKPGSVVGIQFTALGAAPILNLRAGQLTGRHVSLADVWGASSRRLRERLVNAGSPQEMFAAIERELLVRLRRPLLIHPAVAHSLRELNASPAVSRVEEIRAQTGYSAKRLIELFDNAVGLTPKVYSRIRRFQSVIDSLARGRPVAWAAVAADNGYYDQSHLNREFRAFAGVTPGEYRAAEKDQPNHVVVLERAKNLSNTC